MTAVIAASVVVAGAFGGVARGDDDQFPAGSQTRSAGSVTATLSWNAGADGPTAPVLRITRAGVTSLDKSVADIVCATCTLSPLANSDLKIVDLDGDGEPEVLVHGITGGLDARVIIGIFSYDPTGGGYSEFITRIPDHDDEINGEVRDFNRDGHYVIIGGDLRFHDRFPGGVTWYPPIAYAFSRPNGKPTLTDVTRQNLQAVRSDAALALNAVTHPDTPGSFDELSVEINHAIMADYLADEYTLRRGAAGLKEIDQQTRLGRLGGPKTAAAYRTKLLALLKTLGYR